MLKLTKKKVTVVLAAIAFMLIAAACCLLQGFRFVHYFASADSIDVTEQHIDKVIIKSNINEEIPKDNIQFVESSDGTLTLCFILIPNESPISGLRLKRILFQQYSGSHEDLNNYVEMELKNNFWSTILGNRTEFIIYYEFYDVPSLELPEDPVKEGYVFTGWYFGTEEEHSENCLKYDGTPITEDTNLHAHFALSTYTVSFDSAGGSSVSDITVDWNTSLNAPVSEREGYDFKGWFFENGTKYENQAIKENTTLTAHWEIKHFKVTFYVGDVVYRELSVDWGTSLIDAAVKAEVCAESIRSYRTANGENGTNPKEKFVEEDIEVYATEVCEKNPLEEYEWAIIGGVCGGIVLIAGIVAACVIGRRKKENNPPPKKAPKTKKGKNGKYATYPTVTKSVTQPKQAGKGRAVLGKIWKSALVLVLVAILGVGVVGVTYICTDGFGGNAKTLIVAIGNEAYTDNADGLQLFPNTTVRLTSLTGNGSYSIAVRANAKKTNFSFMVGEERYEWSDVEGKEFTKGFHFENTMQGFNLGYESLESIIASGFSESITVEELNQAIDIFEMEITCGKSKLVFGFSVGLPVSGVEIDKDQIIM